MLDHLRCQRMVEMGESKQLGGAKGSARRRKMTMMKGMMASVCVSAEWRPMRCNATPGHKPQVTGHSETIVDKRDVPGHKPQVTGHRPLARMNSVDTAHPKKYHGLPAVWPQTRAFPFQSRRSSVAEQRFRKPSVGGSIPPAGSISTQSPARVDVSPLIGQVCRPESADEIFSQSF